MSCLALTQFLPHQFFFKTIHHIIKNVNVSIGNNDVWANRDVSYLGYSTFFMLYFCDLCRLRHTLSLSRFPHRLSGILICNLQPRVRTPYNNYRITEVHANFNCRARVCVCVQCTHNSQALPLNRFADEAAPTLPRCWSPSQHTHTHNLPSQPRLVPKTLFKVSAVTERFWPDHPEKMKNKII